jgi:hypothetical protein
MSAESEVTEKPQGLRNFWRDFWKTEAGTSQHWPNCLNAAAAAADEFPRC